MSGTVWTKFYWADWETDPNLKLCSLAAQGLWMRMLCIAASHDPIGYVAVAGRPLGVTDLARMTGASETELDALLGELDRNGVFSRDRHGRIYSRRMNRDARLSAEARKNGLLGGNPSLGKGGGKPRELNPPDNPRHKPQSPRASTRVGALSSAQTPGGGEAAAGRADGPPAPRLEREGKGGLEGKAWEGKAWEGKTWEGPADLRAAVVAARGEDYARAWLDQTSWRDGPAPAVICPRSLTEKRLLGDFRRLFKARGILVRTQAMATDGATDGAAA